MKRWNIGEPGGPAGPFYSIVDEDGKVIAMQIPDKNEARRIVLMREFIKKYKMAIMEIESLNKEARDILL